MLELNGGSKDGLEIHPNLWAGVGLVRGGAGTAMVGSHTEIADLVEQYAAVGIEEFVLSGYPHLEESYWFGEGVLPELARRGLWEHPAPPVAGPASVPFGGARGGVVSARVAVVVGNPKPASPHPRRGDLRRPRARAAPSPTWSSTWPRSAAGLLDWADPEVGDAGRRGRRGRPGRGRQPDVQGDLHRTAQAVPRPVRRTATGCAASPYR